MLKHTANYRGVKLAEATCDWHGDNSGNHADLWPWKIFAIHCSLVLLYDSTLLKISPYTCNTTCTALHKHEWGNKKGEETEQRTATAWVVYCSCQSHFKTPVTIYVNPGLSVGFWVAGSVHKVSGYSKACTPFKEGMEGHRHSSIGESWGVSPRKLLPKMILWNAIWAHFQQTLCKSVHPTLFYLLYFNHCNFVIRVYKIFTLL